MIGFLMVGSRASAAQMSWELNQTNEAVLNQPLEARLFLNTQGENINAVSGEIVLPIDFFLVKEIRAGNSIVNFWIEQPFLRESNQVVFSGIIPGGFKAEKGLLLSLILQPLKTGAAIINLEQGQALLNDGAGTAAALSVAPWQLAVSSVGANPPVDYTLNDTTPPEDFVPEVGQSPDLFDNQWFVTFVAQDKQSGINSYEILESLKKYSDNKLKNKNLPWIKARSPYLLSDQKLRSYVYIKAIDNLGNARFVAVSPLQPIKWYENYLFWSIMILAAILLSGKFFWRVAIKKKKI